MGLDLVGIDRGTAVEIESGVIQHQIRLNRDNIVGAACRYGGIASTCGDRDAIVAGVPGVHGKSAAEAGGIDIGHQVVHHLVGIACKDNTGVL